MKRTLTQNDMVNDLMNDSNANWTREGAEVMAEYLLQMEDDCGEEMEWDVVSVRCDYSEVQSAAAYARTMGLAPVEVTEAEALELLERETTVIEVGKTGRVIVANY